jgi:hypothetical protein
VSTSSSVGFGGRADVLLAIVEAAPSWMAEDILSASQQIDEGRPAIWLSEN